MPLGLCVDIIYLSIMITASYLSIDDCLVSGNPVNGIPCYMVNADGKMYVLQVKKLQWKGWGKRNF